MRLRLVAFVVLRRGHTRSTTTTIKTTILRLGRVGLGVEVEHVGADYVLDDPLCDRAALVHQPPVGVYSLGVLWLLR
jgi:hypothetical protein